MKSAKAGYILCRPCWINDPRRSGPLVLTGLSRAPARPWVRIEIIHQRIRSTILLLLLRRAAACLLLLLLRKREEEQMLLS